MAPPIEHDLILFLGKTFEFTMRRLRHRGYQCAFALGLGFARCVGYDLLCNMTVQRKTGLVTPPEGLLFGGGQKSAIPF